MPYLVDGNNLAHALGLSSNGQADRDACLKVVDLFCRSQGAQAIIVFDGPGAARAHPPSRRQPVTVMFSERASADEAILRVLSESKTPRDFVVVTSDKSLGDKARHRGARVERAHEFARRLGRDRGSTDAASEKPSRRETPLEIEEWLRAFEGRPGGDER